MMVDCFHCLEELKCHVVKTGTIIRGKCVDIFQANPPNPAQFGIFAKLFCDITHGSSGRILRGELSHPRAAMHLNGEIPEGCYHGKGTNELCRGVNRFPAHCLANLPSTRPASTSRGRWCSRRNDPPVLSSSFPRVRYFGASATLST